MPSGTESALFNASPTPERTSPGGALRRSSAHAEFGVHNGVMTDDGARGERSLYRDRWITCTAADLRIRGYYFPWGTKRIPYSSIRGLRRVGLGTFTGQLRIWGTSNPRYWVSLDPQRPRKTVGLIIDVGKYVSPVITPDDPDAVEAIIRHNAHLPPAPNGGGRSPLV